MSEPWEESDVWKSKSEFFTWLRGQIRKSIWSNYPIKNEFKKNATFLVTDTQKKKYGLSPRCKKAGLCVLCGNMFPASKLQVDHIEQAGSIRDFSEVGAFIRGIACSKSNMQLVCSDCHKVKNHMERYGGSFEEARATKEAIAIQKAKEDNQWLRTRNIEPGRNAKARRQQIIDVLLKDQK